MPFCSAASVQVQRRVPAVPRRLSMMSCVFVAFSESALKTQQAALSENAPKMWVLMYSLRETAVNSHENPRYTVLHTRCRLVVVRQCEGGQSMNSTESAF